MVVVVFDEKKIFISVFMTYMSQINSKIININNLIHFLLDSIVEKLIPISIDFQNICTYKL